MDTTEELVASLTTTYDMAVVAAFLEISHGTPLMDAMQGLYELAQKMVIENPQAYGLEAQSC